MKTHLLLLPVLLVAVAAATPAVRAALIAQESFNYPTGNLFGQGSTSDPGWSSSWNSSSGLAATVTTPGLVNPVYGGGIGNAAYLTGSTASSGSSGIYRELNDITPGNNIYYVGFLFRHDTDATRTTVFSLFNLGTEMVGAGVSNSSTSMYGKIVFFANGVTAATTTVSATKNTTLQLVMKIMFSSTGNETVRLFVNQATEGTYDAQLTPEIADFTRVRLFAGNATAGGGAATFDAIRIATTYQDAIPEPGALALLLGGAGLVCRSSRRRPANTV
jgi:hypothetical protein